MAKRTNGQTSEFLELLKELKMFEERTFQAINLGLDWGIIQRFIDSLLLPVLSPIRGEREVSNIFISILSPSSQG